jgi:hypothetical protein
MYDGAGLLVPTGGCTEEALDVSMVELLHL